MGSEVKFRAKVLNSKNWIYRQPFHIRGTWYMYNSLWDMVPIEHRTLGQYTGLKDKIGKEIYGGDISKQEIFAFEEIRTFIGEVKMYEGCWWIDSGTAAVLLWNEMHELEVIGNIYENPELLEANV
jgi:uncharacterized phage protein (TIGR01671 family)